MERWETYPRSSSSPSGKAGELGGKEPLLDDHKIVLSDLASEQWNLTCKGGNSKGGEDLRLWKWWS
jgi:hypothetical protein